MITQNELQVHLLGSQEKWYGVTYQEDRPKVKAGISAYVEAGLYPTDLWK